MKQEIISIAANFSVQVCMVASHDHQLQTQPDVEIVQVDRSDQSVDLYIANHLKKGDILITQDFGLAALGISRKAIVLSFRGQQYTEQNIDFLLARRHTLAKQRRGGMRTKGPRAMLSSDIKAFQHTLTKVLNIEQEYE